MERGIPIALREALGGSLVLHFGMVMDVQGSTLEPTGELMGFGGLYSFTFYARHAVDAK